MLSVISQTEKDKPLCYHLYVESKKIRQRMNITKQKETLRYKVQTSGYQWSSGREEKQDRGRRLRGTDYYIQDK